MNAPSKIVDHLVIGGGPAGSMLACLLAEAGHNVTILEKERGAHHKVCGEFLSAEAVGYLRRIGLSPEKLGATRIRAVRLSSLAAVAEAALPFSALSLSRYVLDEALLARALNAGCEVQRGKCAGALAFENGVWSARFNDGESVRAQTVFLATGKHDLHGWQRTHGRQSDLIGFKLHWQLASAQTDALRDVMELFLFPGGYGGLSLVERDAANLCLVVKRSALRRMGDWTNLLRSILAGNRRVAEVLQGANPLWPRPLAISPIPYGYAAQQARGLWRLGDQAAVIPSFTGDGMAIALHSASLAAQMYLEGESADAYTRALHEQLRGPVSLAVRLSQAAVTGTGRIAGPFALAMLPGAMRWIAASTRVPASALLSGNDAPAPARSALPTSSQAR
ncbi:MAG: NAD(P)/FAD-dependent oxidoreductase [Terracidiphilus sp.]